MPRRLRRREDLLDLVVGGRRDCRQADLPRSELQEVPVHHRAGEQPRPMLGRVADD